MSREWTCRMFSDDNAISTVVSFILILGLLITVIAFVKVQYVPQWTEDVEARHARDVFVDFSAIPGNIDDLVLANGSTTVSQNRIKLGSSGTPIVAPGMSYGTLGVVPGAGGGSFKVDTHVWNVNISSNVTAGNLTEGCVNITNVSGVSAFYIHIDEIEYNIGSPGYVFVDFTNQSGGMQSRGVAIETTNNTGLKISVGNCYGNKVIEDFPINVDNLVLKDYTIDLLNPCYGFDMVLDEAKVLADADALYFNLTVTNSTSLNGSHIKYHIDYNEYNRTLVHYTKTSNGTMMYESRNRHFVNQKFIYQNGAVFLCQMSDVTMRTAPGVSIGDCRNYTRMLMPMISVGTGSYRIPMISGSGVEELQIELKHADRIAFSDGNNTDKVSITITPPEGDAEFRNNYLQEWADYFSATVNGTGVKASSTNTTNWTNLIISLTGNIHLDIRDIDVEGRIASISSQE
ncbi:MAG: hypothetical protein U9N12_07515 [Euryarchaeota archaeon]|nr:hypothetical protein [Euryarchaeota archaeon]